MTKEELLRIINESVAPGPNECILWAGNYGKRVGPIITVKGKARSVRRMLWRATRRPLAEQELIKATDTRCHWRCLNLDHFHIEYVDSFYQQYR